MARPSQAFDPNGAGLPARTSDELEKRTAIRWHAVRDKTVTLDDGSVCVFSGDGPCPGCHTVIWVDWDHTCVTMRCPKCGYSFDGPETIGFLTSAAYRAANYPKLDLLFSFTKTLLTMQASSPARNQSGARRRAEIERTASVVRGAFRLAMLSEDYGAAQVFQLQLMQLQNEWNSL